MRSWDAMLAVNVFDPTKLYTCLRVLAQAFVILWECQRTVAEFVRSRTRHHEGVLSDGKPFINEALRPALSEALELSTTSGSLRPTNLVSDGFQIFTSFLISYDVIIHLQQDMDYSNNTSAICICKLVQYCSQVHQKCIAQRKPDKLPHLRGCKLFCW